MLKIVENVDAKSVSMKKLMVHVNYVQNKLLDV